MRKKIADVVRCPTCSKVTKQEEFDEFCDWCEAKIDNHGNTLYRRIDLLPEEVGDYPSPVHEYEPAFCNLDCVFRWLRSDKYRAWSKIEGVRTSQISVFEYLSVQQMDRLVEELKK